VSDYDHVYLAGNYACINFLVADEVALDLKISQFLEDPLFQLTQSKDKKILVYENVTRSLAYNSGLVYTVEVCV
ncbi:MAG: MerR family transcriptional regulator, partial [Lactococcus sp.]|nr:MerR family transcriptional regulator [Lactococcus sp.]